MAEAPRSLEELVRPHIDSFDYFIGEGLQNVVELLKPVEIEQPGTSRRARVWFESPRVALPLKDDAAGAADKRLFPRDCREADAGGGPTHRLTRLMGHLPIMLRSTACYLRDLTPAQLVARKEEAMEVGGYFICNGLERIIRMLIQQRRHYVMGLRRSAYQKRGPTFTDVATLLRCVRRDETSATVRCHYLWDGTASFAFTIARAEYFVPVGVLLKCFLEVSDRELYTLLLALIPQDPGGGDTAVADCAERLLQAVAQLGLHTRVQCLESLGSLFRGTIEAAAHLTDLQVRLPCLVVRTQARWRTHWTAFQGLGGMESDMAAKRRNQGCGMRWPLDARICALFTYMPDRSSSVSCTTAPSTSCRTAHLPSISCNTRWA
ncbi:g5307 [Coccomyxa elongata]